MKKLSRSIMMGMALSLMVLVGLTGSAAAAKPAQTFTVGSVAYTPATLTYPARLEAFDLKWQVYRPDTACISVWDGTAPVTNTTVCSGAIKGSDEKYPQGLYVSGQIDETQLSAGASYNLRVDLMRHGKVIASSTDSYPITAGTSYQSNIGPQP